MGGVKVRKMILAKLDLHVAAIGDFQSSFHRARTIFEALIHLFGRLEIKLVGFQFQAIIFIDRFAGLHAQQARRGRENRRARRSGNRWSRRRESKGLWPVRPADD